MKLRCAFCGRLTEPAVMIGTQAVGPTCARRAGLLGKKPAKGSAIRIVSYKAAARTSEPQTIDMFEDLT